MSRKLLKIIKHHLSQNQTSVYLTVDTDLVAAFDRRTLRTHFLIHLCRKLPLKVAQ